MYSVCDFIEDVRWWAANRLSFLYCCTICCAECRGVHVQGDAFSPSTVSVLAGTMYVNRPCRSPSVVTNAGYMLIAVYTDECGAGPLAACFWPAIGLENMYEV